MNYIIETLRERYYVDYDVKDKIIFIRESISVKDFVKLKEMLKKSNYDGDLRVGRFI